jgi:hypothetical protein
MLCLVTEPKLRVQVRGWKKLQEFPSALAIAT